MTEILFVLFGGMIAGTLGGLLGIGGGIILMPILRFYLGFSPAMAAGTCIVAVFFTTLGGSYRHYKLGNLKLKPLVPVIVSGALFTFVFSILFLFILKKPLWLDRGVAIVFFIVSVRMLIEGIMDLKGKKSEKILNETIKTKFSIKILIGALAGILPGLLGIGTGAVLVPAFKFLLKTPIKIAVSSSLACFTVNAFISMSMKYYQGYVNWQTALVISAGTLVGANLGAILNKKFSYASIKIIFGVVFIMIAIKYIGVF